MKKLLKDLHCFAAEAARQILETPIYDLGIRCYAGAVRLASPFSPKARLLAKGHRNIWKMLEEKIVPGTPYIWIHAASLGEFEQGRPIIEELKRRKPEYKILLTFFSPSGYEVRKNYTEADIVCYLPFDTLRNARRFINIVKPEKAFFIKYEFWRNYLSELAKHNIPTYLVSAIFRKEQPFFKKRGSWYAAWLRLFTQIFVQDDQSIRLLESINIRNATKAGDTRFDRVTDIQSKSHPIAALDTFCNGEKSDSEHRLTIMVGSSWPEDEDNYIDWVNNHKEIKTVIAPHEFDSRRLQRLRERFNGKCILLSEANDNPDNAKDADVMIIDCFGLLSSAYRYCNIAYIGGGFGAGIHNVNEAAVYGVPVIFGPNHTKFKEAIDLVTLGGGISVINRKSTERILNILCNDKEEREKRGRYAAEYIRENIGATQKILNAIFNS